MTTPNEFDIEARRLEASRDGDWQSAYLDAAAEVKRLYELMFSESATKLTGVLLSGKLDKFTPDELATFPMLYPVFVLKQKYADKWRDQPQAYWFFRLMEEVGELGASLAGDHKDPPELELKEITSICLNWLEILESRGDA